MFRTSRQPWLVQFAAAGMVTLLTIPCGTTWGDAFSWEPDPVSEDWNDPGNWAGPLGGVPDSLADTALVSGIPTTGFDPTLTSHRTIGALTISNDGDVLTGDGGGNNYSLSVLQGSHAGLVQIGGTGSSLRIYPSAFYSDVIADAMTINADGNVTLHGAGSTLEVKALNINAGGAISGAGRIWINSANSIINDGTIRAVTTGGASELTILPTTAGQHFDMDGSSGNGAIEATAGTTLYVQTQIDDSFDGTLTIGRNAEFYMDAAWTLSAGSGGTIDFDGGTGTASLSGANLTSDSIINVNSGKADFDARLFANPGSTLNIAANTTIEFDAQANLRNPDNIHNGDGSTWIIKDNVTVGEGTGDFDWDGDATGSSRTRVDAAGQLNIDVARVDTAPVEAYHGLITLFSGNVDVQNADGQWELAGELDMQNVANDPPLLSGDEVLVTGTIAVSGTGESRIRAATIFDTTSWVDVSPGAELKLGNTAPIAFIGGQWTGAGTVELNADWNVIFYPTTVNMPNGVFDLDGTAQNRLDISAPITLNVRAVDDDFVNEVRDEITIRSDAQLNVQFTNPADTYRITHLLDLEALGGTGSTVHLAGAAVELSGATTVTGNSISDARVTIAGTMDIASGGSFNLRGGTETAPDWILASATFAGSGSLINSAGSAAALENGAFVDVKLINRGHLEIGSSTGTAHIDSFIQAVSGQYEVEIDGLIPVNEYDQLTVENAAALDGNLEILINENGGVYADPSVPGTFDEFVLIISGDAVAGEFSNFIYDGEGLTLTSTGGGLHRFHVGDGLFRILSYGTEEVGLLNYQALPGDANGDGIVDGLDFVIWNASKFTSGNKWTTGDFTGDGITDGLDFVVWNAHKFTSVVGFPTLVPEPTSPLWLLAALMIFSWHALPRH